MFHNSISKTISREEDRIQSSRGRQSSIRSLQRNLIGSNIGTLCETNQISTDHKNITNFKNKDDRYSLRKLAKTLLFNTEQISNIEDGYTLNNEFQYINKDYSYNDTDNNHNGSNNFYRNNQQERVDLNSKNCKTNSTSNNEEYIEHLTRLLENQKQYGNQHLSHHIYSNEREYGVDKNNEKLNNKVINNKALQNNEGITNVKNNIYNKVNDDKLFFNIIVIHDIPKPMSISTLVSQLYGGPIERIELFKRGNFQNEKILGNDTNINWNEISIFLHFNKSEDAQDFYNYSKTELFKVNDIELKTLWIPNSQYYAIEIPKDDLVNERKYQEIINRKRQENLIISELLSGEERARRVLVFKKPITEKKNKNDKRRSRYPDPTINFSGEFDIEEIRKDFEIYGQLIEVLPVVSRKLCFGVHYYDVRSAIKVKNIIQRGNNGINNEELNSKDNEIKIKYSGWYVWYGRDPADRGIPV